MTVLHSKKMRKNETANLVQDTQLGSTMYIFAKKRENRSGFVGEQIDNVLIISLFLSKMELNAQLFGQNHKKRFLIPSFYFTKYTWNFNYKF